MEDNKHVNERLSYYLDKEEYEDFWELIKTIIKDDAPRKAKYNLLCLLMDRSTQDMVIDNLRDRLRNVYCSDKNIAAYLNKRIGYNPKLGYVYIEAKSQRDMENYNSLYIHLPVKHDSADQLMERCREVLTMMLIESKTIPA